MLKTLTKEQQERPTTEMVKFLDKELGGTEEEKMFESYKASMERSTLILAAEIFHGEVGEGAARGRGGSRARGQIQYWDKMKKVGRRVCESYCS